MDTEWKIIHLMGSNKYTYKYKNKMLACFQTRTELGKLHATQAQFKSRIRCIAFKFDSRGHLSGHLSNIEDVFIIKKNYIKAETLMIDKKS